MKLTLIDSDALAEVKNAELNYFAMKFGKKFIGLRDVDYYKAYRITHSRLQLLAMLDLNKYTSESDFLN